MLELSRMNWELLELGTLAELQGSQRGRHLAGITAQTDNRREELNTDCERFSVFVNPQVQA